MSRCFKATAKWVSGFIEDGLRVEVAEDVEVWDRLRHCDHEPEQSEPQQLALGEDRP